MKKIPVRSLAVCAMIAALYTALCLALPLLSYGPVQIRAAEALTLLPVFSPLPILGVTLGCFLSNLAGFLTGANPLGLVDAVFGTAATLIAAVLSYRLRGVRFRGIPVLSAVPPVLVNMLIVGGEITFLETGGFSLVPFVLIALSVGAGQVVSCFLLGLPLVHLLERSRAGRLLEPQAGR